MKHNYLKDYCYSMVEFKDEFLNMYGRKMPRTVTFIVTEDCPLRCSYCYQHNKSKRRMSLETAKKCVDTLFAEDAANSEYINSEDAEGIILDFIGGEPLLEIELIDNIVDYFLKQAIVRNHRWAIKYMISISSNGVLYKEKNVQSFLKKHENRVSIGITIDGDKELHDSCRVFPDGSGSYDLAAEAFDDVLHRFNQEGTKLTLAPANIQYFAKATKNMFENFDMRYLHANCVYEEGWTIEHARILYEQMKEIADWIVDNDYEKKYHMSMFDLDKYGPMNPEDNNNYCGGTGAMLAFGVDGVIYPCQRYSPASIGPDIKPLIVGHIDHGIEKTQEEKDVCAQLRKITRRSCSTDECFNCPVASGCGYCSAYCYEKTGDANIRTTYICWMHRATSLANVYFWNKLARKHDIPYRFEMHLPQDLAVQIVGEEEYNKLKELEEK